jgi:RNA polymerase sigma factor (sigma-70 family)
MANDATVRTDQELWDAVVEGDAEAFGELFTKHHNDIYNYCFRRTGSWAVAEDLVSVVFMEVWRTRRALSLESSSLLPWLIGVATRLTHRHHRTSARYDALIRRIPADPESAELDDVVAGRIDDERRMAEVLAAVERLPRREQDVLAACVFAELDYAAAAVALGIPVGTVRSRLSRARRRLMTLTSDVAPLPTPNR